MKNTYKASTEMSETKCLLLFVDECLKQKILQNLKTVRINFDKAAVYEINIQDNCTVYTSIKEVENVILNRYLSEEQKLWYSRGKKKI